MPASAATKSATLKSGDISAWAKSLTAKKIQLITAINYADSNRKVYFDFKYYDGNKWVKDKNAVALDINRSIASSISSSTKAENMSWGLQINAWGCLYDDAHAYGTIST